MAKVKIQIKSYLGSVLFEAEKEDYTVKQAVSDAVLSGADLSGAVLSAAVLSGADLSDAVLSGADLRRADLSGAVLSAAVLSGADLSDAVLRRADLSGAVLSDANLKSVEDLGDYLNQCSRDMLFVFMHLRGELPGLRKALVEGRISGTQYEGECACLIGTLAKLDGGIEKVCNIIPYYEKGLNNYCEQWFWQIREGDTPENSLFAAHAVKLIDMVLGQAAHGN